MYNKILKLKQILSKVGYIKKKCVHVLHLRKSNTQRCSLPSFFFFFFFSCFMYERMENVTFQGFKAF